MSGGVVCCVVIFTSDNKDGVNMLWTTGVYIRIANPVKGKRNKIDLKLKEGEGKNYHGGPTCIYNGKQVNCLTFSSESGGNTGKILIEILA